MAIIWRNLANIADIQQIIQPYNFAPSNRGMGRLLPAGR
ncbi:hypothetical protein M091_0332 [Parabacteroides distasonis str. 3776 D15 i]|uniref:Uncharacterized protein n=1 Tax=Parabacteroides distasonis str. 3776 D15 i TaxID=1339342 RepID=A0AB34LDB1_PARDI|nr:hypothetical protein M091_0332 [Parabacteroides distasonis str. 3776 D15 i]